MFGSGVSFGRALLAVAILMGAFASSASAEEPANTFDVKRTGAVENANFHLNGIDDYRVDAGIAILDQGIMDPGEITPGINFAHRANCVNPDPWRELQKDEKGNPLYVHPSPEDPNWEPDELLNGAAGELPFGTYGCLDNSGKPFPDQLNETGGVGTENRALKAAGIDGFSGLGGVAPGARVWSVRILSAGSDFGSYRNPKSLPESPEYDPEAPEYLPEMGTAHLIAGLDWVAEHAGEINVALIATGCARKGDPEVEETGAEVVCEAQGIREALARVVDKGVVPVALALNTGTDTEHGAIQSIPDAFTVSAASDSDGKPGGEGAPCGSGPDDQRVAVSAYGTLVDLGAAACGDTNMAAAHVAGAAAALASQCPAHNRAGVEFIEDTLMAEGDTGEINEGGWKDDSGDAWKEPLLNLRNESVFDPVLESTTTHTLNHEPSEHCPWLSHQAPSDVNSDGRSDLVAINSQGSAKDYQGTYEGPQEAPSKDGFEASPKTSLESQLNPAIKDGKGEYTIGSADVNGDRHADLVTFEAGKGVEAYPGNGEGGFGSPTLSMKGATLSFDGSEGQLEPIGLGDVTGDGRADLVALLGTNSGVLLTFPGQADGSFGEAIASQTGIDSAFLDGKGEYFLGVADVSGEELNEPEAKPINYFARHSNADVVAMNTNGTVYVYKGAASGKFSAKVAAATLNPIMDDGKGVEPVGLGDVNRDRRADLLVLEGETLKLLKATKEGTFEAPVTAYEGKVDSSLTDGKGSELLGLLDYSRDGLADLVALNEEGKLLTYTAKRNFTFEAPKTSEAKAPSIRQSATGSEYPIEPLFERLGCTASGCAWKAPSHAPRFDAKLYPATLKGGGLKTLVTKAGTVECEEASLQGSLAEPSPSLSLAPTYGKCKVIGSLPVEVAPHSCRYGLAAKDAGPPYKGSLSVACEKEGDKIEYKVHTETGIVVCTVKVGPQSGLEGLALENKGEGQTETFQASGEAKGLKYELAGSKCGTTGSFTEGVMKGTATLSGSSEAGIQVGAYLTGKETAQLEAESFPASLKGGGLKAFITKEGTVECEEAGLSGTLAAASTEGALAATYGKCKVGGLTTEVVMNSCRYGLGVNNEGPPYKGSWGVACEKEGAAIEFKVLVGATVVCKASVPPQPGLGGVSLANSGEGAKRAVSLEAEVKGIEYSLSGGYCTNGTYTDGVMKGSSSLAGTNGKGEGEGVYLGG